MESRNCLPPQGTALYAAAVTPLSEESAYRAAYRLVSRERREKTDRYRFPQQRRLSLGAELLLLLALRLAGVTELPATVTDSGGKPRFAQGSLQFSLSHSGEYVLCALSRQTVGCDIQQITKVDGAALARRFFTPAEAAKVAAEPSETAQRELFFRYWALKESFEKATGLGLALPPRDFEIILGERIEAVQRVDACRYRFAEYGEIPGYRCAVCVQEGTPPASLRVLALEELF